MASYRRIHCHFCGTRSPYSKSSGIAEFQCTSCEAVNFLDSKGDIIDTPASAIVWSQNGTRDQSPPFQTFTQQLPETLGHQQSQVFCNTCVKNHHMYVEALGNYLPDEDDPRYQEYEDALPQFKNELEKRYPQVCKSCAPNAQRKINRSDYYAGTQNINRLAEQTARRGLRSAKGTRDDWWRWSMRLVLGAIGMAIYASLLLQVAWHAYGMFVTSTPATTAEWEDDAGLAFDPMPQDCVRESLRMRFSHTCHQLLGAYIPRALLVSLCLSLYNPGLKAWYHHTHRIEVVTGQMEHFRMQVVLLIIRTIAWVKLSDTTVVQGMTAPQLMAAHGFVAMFMLLVQWLSNRTIKSKRFRLRQKMMPRPEDRDVLGAFAGPESETYDRHASSIPPSQLFARERIDRITPFPISSLAPKRSTRDTQMATTMPSPPPSDETDDEGDPMDIDDQPSTFRSQMPGAKVDRTYRPKVAQKRTNLDPRSVYNHGNTQPAGWSSMRDQIFGMQDNLQLQAERRRREEEGKSKLRYQPPVQQSPFRGRLPAAPMSMERKLRNPVTQLAFKGTPVSKQQNFMQQIRNGIEQGKTFTKCQEVRKQYTQPSLSIDGEDEDFSPIKNRTRGGLELRQSTWQLPGDAAQATGLEDLFGGNSFRIVDEPAITMPASQRKDDVNMLKLVLGLAVPVVVAAVSFNVMDIRRTVCLWLVARIEDMGY